MSGRPSSHSRQDRLGDLLQDAVELLGREILVDPLDGGEFARQPVQCGFVDLAFAVGLVGLAGIILIVKPGTAGLASIAAIIGALSGISAAAAMIGIRRISNTEPASRIVFYFLLLSSFASALPLPWLWQTPDLPGWLWLLGVGAFATAGQFLMTKAYTVATASYIGPFTYTSVIFAGALGWALWGEAPDLWSLAGISLVIGSCLITLLPRRNRAVVDGPTEV